MFFISYSLLANSGDMSLNLRNILLILGTADFLHANPNFVQDQTKVQELHCNKDTGGLKAYHSWSRGVFFIVSGGGHIEYWQPLYR